MPLGFVQFRMRKPYIYETQLEIVPQSLRQSGWGMFQFTDLADDLDVEYEIQNGQPQNVRRYAVVPEPIRRLLDIADCNHPGLALDKFVYRCADQSFVRGALQKVIATRSSLEEQYEELRRRWLQTLDYLGATRIRCTTTGSLTLHLARASALENAGICLHPLKSISSDRIFQVSREKWLGPDDMPDLVKEIRERAAEVVRAGIDVLHLFYAGPVIPPAIIGAVFANTCLVMLYQHTQQGGYVNWGPLRHDEHESSLASSH